jgi:hypothetical protein
MYDPMLIPPRDPMIVENDVHPVVMERQSRVGVVIAVLVIAAVIAGAIWLSFIADDETQGSIVPDTVGISLDG